MTAVAEIVAAPLTYASTEQMGMPQSYLPASAYAMASIMLGIEQAKNNEGTFLSDDDLQTDEDD